MGWVIYFAITFSVMLVAVPFKRIREYWLAGVVGIVVIFVLDSTLIKLNAYSFSKAYIYIKGIPLLYMLTAFPGGVIFLWIYEQANKYKFLTMLFISYLFLIIEFIMIKTKYFHHIRWDGGNSFFLNITGFVLTLWLYKRIYKLKQQW